MRRRRLVGAAVALAVAGGAAAGVAVGGARHAPHPAAGLATRLAALGLPPASDSGFHIHVRLRVFVDGRAVPVPSQIGIDAAARVIAPLHTHDASGIVHVESARPYPFTLGQVFAVWGVPLSGRRLQVFANGRLLAHPAARVLHAHDHLVVGFGAPGSFPPVDRTPFPPGL
jgi:hypothetical protein